MKKSCPRCELNNLAGSRVCVRCNADLSDVAVSSQGRKRPSVARRVIVCAFICLLIIPAFFISLLVSSTPLSPNEQAAVERAIGILEKAGFDEEVGDLRTYAFFRSDDNWLNSMVPKENAYAATNYPFGIITVYPDFFTYSQDDVERAAILLHEAKHLKGEDERQAYEFVWENKSRIGWTWRRYATSVVWLNVRKQTREYAPGLFSCEFNDFGDCLAGRE